MSPLLAMIILLGSAVPSAVAHCALFLVTFVDEAFELCVTARDDFVLIRDNIIALTSTTVTLYRIPNVRGDFDINFNLIIHTSLRMIGGNGWPDVKVTRTALCNSR